MTTSKLSDLSVQRCLTASGWLLKDNKILMIKHKMLGIWLSPGGHVEDNELPHKAAEREFLEETGVTVKAISATSLLHAKETEYLPMPFVCNLHWINPPGKPAKKNPHTGKICQQHYVFGYFVSCEGECKLDDSDLGVDAVKWFSRDEITNLETTETIKEEANYVFDHYPHQ